MSEGLKLAILTKLCSSDENWENYKGKENK